MHLSEFEALLDCRIPSSANRNSLYRDCWERKCTSYEDFNHDVLQCFSSLNRVGSSFRYPNRSFCRCTKYSSLLVRDSKHPRCEPRKGHVGSSPLMTFRNVIDLSSASHDISTGTWGDVSPSMSVSTDGSRVCTDVCIVGPLCCGRGDVSGSLSYFTPLPADGVTSATSGRPF